MEGKICIKCSMWKDLSNFYFIKKSNKYNNQCRSCTNEYMKEYRNRIWNGDGLKNYQLYRIFNWEKCNEYRRKYYWKK